MISLKPVIYESRNFLVLCPVLLKFNISAQLIETFPEAYGSCSSAEGKLSIPREAHDFLKTRNLLVFLPAQPTRCPDFGKTTGRVTGDLELDGDYTSKSLLRKW